MPEKRPRDDDESSSIPDPSSSLVSSVKRSRTDTQAQEQQSNPSILGWIVSGFSSLLGGMPSQGQRPVSSRSETRSTKSGAGQLPIGVQKLGDRDREDGVLAEILKQDAKRKEESERQTALKAETRPAIVSTSSSSASKLDQRPVIEAAPSLVPVNDYLFDEGRFRVARHGSFRQEDEGNDDVAEGTESQPIDLAESEIEDGDQSSAGPSTPSTPVPQSRPGTPSPFSRRPPARPQFSDHTPSSRDYSWLSPSSSESSSSRQRAEERGTRRKRSSLGSKYRTVQERETDHAKLRKRILKRLTKDETPQRRRAIERSLAHWEVVASPYRSKEAEYRQALDRGEHSKKAFERLLDGGLGRKTIDDILQKPKQDLQSPLKAYQRADASKRLVALQRGSTVSDIVEEFKKSHLRDEEAIAARLKPATPIQMGKERQKKVKSYFSNRAFRSDHKNQSVELRDINTLVGASWLNDEVINMYLAMVQSRNEEAAAAKTQGSYKDVYPMSTFFYQKLAEQGYEKAKLARWTKRAKVDIFAKDIVLIPINVGGMHWTAAALNMEKKRIEYYDSMADKGRHRDEIFANLKSYLEQEHLNKKGTPWDSTDWDFEFFTPKTPQQTNGSDCGVFSCQTLEALARGRDLSEPSEWDFSSKNMPYIRQLMVYELGQAKLEQRWPKEQ